MTGSLDDRRQEDYNGNVAQVSVDLSTDLQRHIDARAADAGIGGSAEYLRALAEQDRRRYEADVARVKALIEEGIASGIDDREPEDILDEILADPDLRD